MQAVRSLEKLNGIIVAMLVDWVECSMVSWWPGWKIGWRTRWSYGCQAGRQGGIGCVMVARLVARLGVLGSMMIARR